MALFLRGGWGGRGEAGHGVPLFRIYYHVLLWIVSKEGGGWCPLQTSTQKTIPGMPASHPSRITYLPAGCGIKATPLAFVNMPPQITTQPAESLASPPHTHRLASPLVSGNHFPRVGTSGEMPSMYELALWWLAPAYGRRGRK